jgi:transposase-like protein
MNKTVRLTVKLLPAHKVALVRLAQREGESVASVLRRLVRVEAEELGLWAEQLSNGEMLSEKPRAEVWRDGED